MDPLSIASGIAGLVTLTAQVSHGFQALRSSCKEQPGRVDPLSNEVNDLRMVLDELSEVVTTREHFTDDDTSSVFILFDRGSTRLEELHELVARLRQLCGGRRTYFPAPAMLWQKLHPQLQALQTDIRSIRGSLVALTGASNSRDMLRIRLDLQDINMAGQHSSGEIINRVALQEERLTGSLDHGFDLVDTRIANVEAHLQLQLAQMEANFTRQIARLQFTYDSNLGPSMALTTHRQIPDQAPAVAFALEGNVDGLKRLFSEGLASPRDVSVTRGYSLLRWALYGQQYEACRFLFLQGADPHYRPISQSDNSPSDKAGDIILRGGLPPRAADILRAIAETSDFVERQNFDMIHKVVLGLSFADLEETILNCRDGVDVPDSGGRTALEWAAARGDERAVTLLLSYGADPNVMDSKLNTPLTLAANQNHAVCVRLLLEAGAEPDPVLPAGIKFGTPLNCAARNASDPMVLKTLVDFDADIEATGVDGVTPLLHVSRNQSSRHAMFLLNAGANINATARDGRTPLTTAITYNNHNVLKLLLDRWYEYSECPRLRGPNLLDVVVQYADLETVRIVSETDYLRLSRDDGYILDTLADKIRKRSDVDEKFALAFDDLLDIIRQAPSLADDEKDAGDVIRGDDPQQDHDNGSQKGWFGWGVRSGIDVSVARRDTPSSTGSDDVFEDAPESAGNIVSEVHKILDTLEKGQGRPQRRT